MLNSITSTIARSSIRASAAPSAFVANDAKIRELQERGLPLSVSLGDDGAVIDAYVTAAQAARLLAPLGPKAKTWSRPMAGGMVAIEAIVSVEMALRVLAASRLSA